MNHDHFYSQENGLSPLMLAVKENKLVIAERLLDLGANINDRANVSTELSPETRYTLNSENVTLTEPP